jgi:hypothetical protein
MLMKPTHEQRAIGRGSNLIKSDFHGPGQEKQSLSGLEQI